MITIDLIGEPNSSIVKPDQRPQKAVHRTGFGMIGRAYTWALSHQNDLFQAAHTTRLLRLARNGGASIVVQRFLERRQNEALTLVERYINRLN